MGVTFKGLDEMQRELETLAKRSVPFAARETLNGMAFAGRAAWQEEMRHALTLRNQFTERRALVDRATTLRMSAMEARLGHTEPYMELLERGGVERAAKRFRPIPTEAAAGLAKGSLRGGRTRAVRPSAVITRLGKLRVSGLGKLSRKARNARAVQGAIRSGRRLALLDLGRRKGVYRVMGGKRRPRIVKLYDLSRRKTPVPRTPTLERAVARALAKGPELAFAALAKQLTRARGSR